MPEAGGGTGSGDVRATLSLPVADELRGLRSPQEVRRSHSHWQQVAGEPLGAALPCSSAKPWPVFSTTAGYNSGVLRHAMCAISGGWEIWLQVEATIAMIDAVAKVRIQREPRYSAAATGNLIGVSLFAAATASAPAPWDAEDASAVIVELAIKYPNGDRAVVELKVELPAATPKISAKAIADRFVADCRKLTNWRLTDDAGKWWRVCVALTFTDEGARAINPDCVGGQRAADADAPAVAGAGAAPKVAAAGAVWKLRFDFPHVASVGHTYSVPPRAPGSPADSRNTFRIHSMCEISDIVTVPLNLLKTVVENPAEAKTRPAEGSAEKDAAAAVARDDERIAAKAKSSLEWSKIANGPAIAVALNKAHRHEFSDAKSALLHAPVAGTYKFEPRDGDEAGIGRPDPATSRSSSAAGVSGAPHALAVVGHGDGKTGASPHVSGAGSASPATGRRWGLRGASSAMATGDDDDSGDSGLNLYSGVKRRRPESYSS